jgi:hypothetical protein
MHVVSVEEGGGIEPLGLIATTRVFGTRCRPFGGAFRGSATIRTLFVGFGDRLLSQEH